MRYEYQGSESGNKPLRHCVKEDVSLEYFTMSPISKQEETENVKKEGRQIANK